MTVYTGDSSTGRKFDAAEMGFSPERPKFEWAEMCRLTVLEITQMQKPLLY